MAALLRRSCGAAGWAALCLPATAPAPATTPSLPSRGAQPEPPLTLSSPTLKPFSSAQLSTRQSPSRHDICYAVSRRGRPYHYHYRHRQPNHTDSACTPSRFSRHLSTSACSRMHPQTPLFSSSSGISNSSSSSSASSSSANGNDPIVIDTMRSPLGFPFVEHYTPPELSRDFFTSRVSNSILKRACNVNLADFLRVAIVALNVILAKLTTKDQALTPEELRPFMTKELAIKVAESHRQILRRKYRPVLSSVLQNPDGNILDPENPVPFVTDVRIRIGPNPAKLDPNSYCIFERGHITLVAQYPAWLANISLPTALKRWIVLLPTALSNSSSQESVISVQVSFLYWRNSLNDAIVDSIVKENANFFGNVGIGVNSNAGSDFDNNTTSSNSTSRRSDGRRGYQGGDSKRPLSLKEILQESPGFAKFLAPRVITDVWHVARIGNFSDKSEQLPPYLQKLIEEYPPQTLSNLARIVSLRFQTSAMRNENGEYEVKQWKIADIDGYLDSLRIKKLEEEK